ncbi:helix-turn-helix domain-containing protein [Nocardia cyriacigeorgica]|uniref:helix-turn-helix domain-containing protein n=1 Tax=Nocardia cyriacigeorgica TaxID=135487 RepID=UPI00189326F3|nr:helix-turn-helix transcriptional regulator [Nocardia cyriacigeorgica]MBF6160133.1 helix-turn-helix domain-containing protein [Nocardia cyriacigeorgica]MBF6199217.1 helix-turn-helix domain-containing protein [Nocardia cyriacigeorgica]MBF6343369.1 helix-turn-helix domain-containing protein [Nocardia cyriacigeorgica]MBF6516050.1 helix-turn-helix domain-containing protein [Nocardia cyriacigeorgica]
MQDTTLPRRRLGSYLMDWRSRAGLSQPQAAALLGIGSTTLWRLEHGHNDRVNIDHVEAACELYGVPDHLVAAYVGLARQASEKSWWHEFGDLIPETFDVYMGMEEAAQTFISYQVELVPGIFQTTDYTRALVQEALPNETPAEHERRVQMRQYRQMIVTRKRQPVEVDVVLHESVLRRTIGSAKVTGIQLKRLADLSTRPNVTLRVLPNNAGVPGGHSVGQFTILHFGTNRAGEPVEPPVVYVPGIVGDMYFEKPKDVHRYHMAYKAFQDRSLDAVDSRGLLRQVAKEFLQ